VLALLVLAALAASCVVTDTIEFEDAVNHPPEVQSFEPANDRVITVCPAEQSFRVDAWDPDPADATTAEARVYLRLNPEVAGEWDVVRECEVTPREAEPAEGGVVLGVTCNLDLGLYGAVQPGARLLVRVELADRGYAQSLPRNDSRTAELLWALEVAPAAACGD